jgi:hypothetical protein
MTIKKLKGWRLLLVWVAAAVVSYAVVIPVVYSLCWLIQHWVELL